MGNPRLTIQLVTWNSLAYLPEFFDSLKQQSFKDFKLCVVDNNSKDGTSEYLKKTLPLLGISHTIIDNKSNTGFAGGHNQAFNLEKSELVAIVNPDIVMEPDCLEKLVAYLDQHAEVAVVAPRLMRVENKNIIDSLGLKIFRSRRVVEIGAGQMWNNQYSEPIKVFGVSGSFFIARRSTLNKNLINNEVFDNWYGSYKEDVDLAWRLQSAGVQSIVLPTAVAYHARGAKPANALNDVSASLNKAAQPAWLKFNSYRNHLATIYKNDTKENLRLDFLFVLWYELKKFCYFLILNPSVLLAWRSLWQARKYLKIARLEIAAKREVAPKEFHKWL